LLNYKGQPSLCFFLFACTDWTLLNRGVECWLVLARPGLTNTFEFACRSRPDRWERTHFVTGTKRLSMYMTKDHFFDLARQSYEENSQPDDSDIEPYQFVECLPVWATDLEESEVECIVRVIRKTSEKVGAKWTQEFEAVLTGTGEDNSPQMWHFDGVYANLAGVGVVCLRSQNPTRGGTELVRYPHKILTDMEAKECYKHIETVFARVERKTAKTPKSYDKCIKQADVVEILTGDNVADSGSSVVGDMTAFYTDHLHRGARNTGQGFAYFCSWEVPEYRRHRAHTDGLPIHLTNWNKIYKKLLLGKKGNKMQQF
jgi:hypothetical protein